MIAKYLRDNPASLHLPAGHLIVSALSEAFPCN
ncbi:Rap1a/Tai family immunity protein [Seohaeicola sp. SP36]